MPIGGEYIENFKSWEKYIADMQIFIIKRNSLSSITVFVNYFNTCTKLSNMPTT
jgi:hypothetical protein